MKLGLAIGLTSAPALRVGGPGYSPAALFENGEAGAWFEPGAATCFQDVAGTIAAGIGDPVGRITDLSGNGNHATQPTSAARPTLAGDALVFDRVDDFLAFGPDLSSQRWTLAIAYEYAGASSSIALSLDGAERQIGLAQEGNSLTSGVYGSGATVHEYRYDGEIEAPGTRGDAHALASGSSTVMADFSPTVSWPKSRFGEYANYGVDPIGNLKALVLVNKPLTADDRTGLLAYFAGVGA